MESCTSILLSSNGKHFQFIVQFSPQPIICLLVLRKPGNSYCKLPLETTEEDKEERQEVTTSLAAAEEISADAAVAAALSEPDCIFTIKEHH